MQETKQKPQKPKFSTVIKIPGITQRALFKPEPSAELDTFLKNAGTPEPLRLSLEQIITAMRKSRQDDEAYHRVDRYLVGGVGAIDLLLLPTILSIGKFDASLNVAFFFLVVSLPLVGSSLFFSFLKQGYGITSYGKIHRKLTEFSLYTGIGAMTALIWHASLLDGIVFLCLTIVMYNICVCYFAIVAISKHIEHTGAGQTSSEVKE